MPQQFPSIDTALETDSIHTTSEERGQKPQPPSSQKPATSERDQPPTQEAVVRDGTMTYEAFADQYFVQGP